MKSMMWEDVSPFLDQPRHFDNELLAKVKKFVQGLGYENVSEKSDEFANSGSSMRVSLFLKGDGKESIAWPVPMQLAPINLEIFISSRGPLITSCGYELRAMQDSQNESGMTDPCGYAPSTGADARAKSLAVEIAQEFNLTYLDREWLRRFSLSEKHLIDDASLSLDFSEPDALNVLFTEYL